jgi:pimeloyl-ACP methyl ester carboxylesterase
LLVENREWIILINHKITATIIIMKSILGKLVLSAFVIAISAQYACQTSQDRLADQGKQKIHSLGVNIAYTDSGKGDTTLLFVHGWCINKSYWTNQVSNFEKRYRVVTIDLPGFGKSGKNRSDFNTIAYGLDVDSVISQLKLKNVILIGHSMSGDIVLQAAVKAPKGTVLGLIGVDNFKTVSNLPLSAKDSLYQVKVLDQMRKHFKQTASVTFDQIFFYKTTADSIRRRVLNDVANSDSIVAIKCLSFNKFNEYQTLKSYNKKIYLINNDVLPTDTAALHALQIPFEISYIHSVGHNPMIEKPQDFNNSLQEQINKIGCSSINRP